jgi:hypothetical protein
VKVRRYERDMNIGRKKRKVEDMKKFWAGHREEDTKEKR